MDKKNFNISNFGLACGVSFGIYALFIGWTSWLFGWGNSIVDLLTPFYLGFTASFWGGIIGGIWAFVDGYIGGVIIAWVYNKLQK